MKYILIITAIIGIFIGILAFSKPPIFGAKPTPTATPTPLGVIKSQSITDTTISVSLSNGNTYSVPQTAIQDYFNAQPGDTEEKKQATIDYLKTQIQNYTDIASASMEIIISDIGKLVNVTYKYGTDEE